MLVDLVANTLHKLEILKETINGGWCRKQPDQYTSNNIPIDMVTPIGCVVALFYLYITNIIGNPHCSRWTLKMKCFKTFPLTTYMSRIGHIHVIGTLASFSHLTPLGFDPLPSPPIPSLPLLTTVVWSSWDCCIM